MVFTPFSHQTFPQGVGEIMDHYQGFLMDIWGVIHDGQRLFPGVEVCLKNFEKHGKKGVFISNSPRRGHEVRAQIQSMGGYMPKDFPIMTSGDGVHDLMTKTYHGAHVYPMLGTQHTHLLADLPIHITHDLHTCDVIFNASWTGEDIHDFQGVLERGVPMVCANPDLAVKVGGRMVPCAGSLAQAYEQKGGRVHYLGKPFPEIYEKALTGMPPSARILAIGDSLRTDIQGALGMGLDAMLVLSGLEGHYLGYSPGDLVPVEKITKRCQEHRLRPTYVLPSFSW